MSKIRSFVNIVGVMVFLFAVTSLAQAQATRTWVSGVGDDANPCSRTAPCKTFAGAISKTAAGGEISVLDPGGFGGITITKAITLNGEGTLAGILSAGTVGIIVNAGAGDTVIIRNISINGAQTGTDGIRVLAGGNVHVENVTIDRVTTNGIFVNATANTNLTVKNTTITNTGTTELVDAAIRITTSTGTARAVITGCLFRKNRVGVNVGERANVLVRDSVAVGDRNTGNPQGYLISAASTSNLTLENCSASHMTNGVRAQELAGGNVNIFLSNNMFSNNDVGVSFGAGPTITSFINNRFAGNTSDSTSPLPTTAQK